MGKAPKKRGRHRHGYVGQKQDKQISKEEALRKLWVNEDEFRKLVILKGIYPRIPQNMKKKNKNRETGKKFVKEKIYYSHKDIKFLRHEPIYHKMNQLKIHERRLKKHIAKNNNGGIIALHNSKPFVTFDHLVKERYPTFYSALNDLDDCLTLMFLFTRMAHNTLISKEEIDNIQKLCNEFMTIVAHMKSLKKTFLAMRGIYYQVVIENQTITWVIPYNFPQKIPKNVDLSIFKTFLAFYQTLMRFINFKLYNMNNISYPPKEVTYLDSYLCPLDLDNTKDVILKESEEAQKQVERIKSIPLKKILKKEKETKEDEMKDKEEEDEEDDDDDDDTSLNFFKDMVFYISRDCPFGHCEFLIKSKGGRVVFNDMDDRITHHIIDRPKLPNKYKDIKSREFIQPQWLFDCVNVGIAIPVEKYEIGKKLPPHLSPFVDYSQEPYVPEYAKELQKIKKKNMIEVEDVTDPKNKEVRENKESKVEEKIYQRELEAEIKGEKYSSMKGVKEEESEEEEDEANLEEEERKLKETMMSRKKFYLYKRKTNSNKRKKERIEKLTKKRRKLKK